MRFYFIAGLALIFNSCQVDYEDNSRLLFKGVVNDGSQNPFPGLPVDVYASTGDGPFGVTERIGVGKTAADGTFDIVALAPKNRTFLQLLINDSFQQGRLPEFGSFTFRRLDILAEDDGTFTIPDIAIEERAESTLEIRRVANLLDTLSFQYSYRNPDRTLDFSQTAPLDKIEDINFLVSFGTLPSAQIELLIGLTSVVVTDTLFLEYRLVNSKVSETFEAELMYNPESDSYVFEF